MVKLASLRHSSWRRSKNVILRVKALDQLQQEQSRKLTDSMGREVRTLDSKYETVREEMSTFDQGMTRFSAYRDRQKTETCDNSIAYPLVRSSEDWQPRPCCLRNYGGSEKCPHFPCRTFTSYHFIFRELPKFVEDAADQSVRKSKTQSMENLTLRSTTSIDDTSEEALQTKHQDNKLPPIWFNDNMTTKERNLKMAIRKIRQNNDAENKPTERCVNYGTPLAVSKLRRPARLAVRDVETTWLPR